MKKKISILLLISIIIIITTNIISLSSSLTYQLKFKILNNKSNEDYKLYILLPKEYIEFAIYKDKLKLDYEGVSTVKNNNIPSLNINKEKIQDDIYEENGVKYIQIELTSEEKDVYTFDILSDYIDKDMKFRIKSDSKDYIIHIDNFKVINNVCDIEYDYQKDIVKQPDRRIVSFNTILIIILIIIIFIGIISYIKKRR